MKSQLKKILPKPAFNILRDTVDGIKRIGEIPQAYLHPWRSHTRKALQKFQDIHAGKRCFILGNGPSLKQTDLSKLKNEFTFGMNRIYLAFDDLGFSTNYYVSVNDLVIEQCADEIMNLDLPRFVSWRSGRKWLSSQENLYFL